MLHTRRLPASFNVFACCTREVVRVYDHVTFGCSGSTSTTPRAASACLPAAPALLQLRRVTPRHRFAAASALLCLRRAPRLLISWQHRLYHTNNVCCDYSSRLYISYVVHRDYSSPVRIGSASTTHRPVAPALLHICRASGRAVSPLDLSSIGRSGSRHAPDHCVSRLDYSSPGCTRSRAHML
jgi:hypothetical protein